MKLRGFIIIWLVVFVFSPVSAQLYTGLSGLINTPSAEMNEEGTARIGGYFMNGQFLPDDDEGHGFVYNGEKYNTMDFYVSIVPFKWIELGYAFTIQKSLEEGYSKPKYNHKDRYFSVKLNPLQEGRYHPAIAIGSNDFLVLQPEIIFMAIIMLLILGTIISQPPNILSLPDTTSVSILPTAIAPMCITKNGKV